MILPHSLWATISEHEKLHAEVFGCPTDWAEWWKRTASEPWFLEHPLRHDILRAPEMHCPYVIHGDDAPIDKRGKRAVRVLQWSSPLSSAPTLMRQLIIFTSESKQQLADLHQAAIDFVTAWSFNVVLSNEHPKMDHLENPIRGVRNFKAGQALHPRGVRMVFSGTVGDWKWHWEELNLRHHYNAEEVCHNCRAVKAAESELCMHNFTVDAPWTLTDRTLTEYIDEQERLDTVSPFCSIRGSIQRISSKIWSTQTFVACDSRPMVGRCGNSH